jgi:hypothetical protein
MNHVLHLSIWHRLINNLLLLLLGHLRHLLYLLLLRLGWLSERIRRLSSHTKLRLLWR